MSQRIATSPSMQSEDLTKIPFVTIDPSDARDHDDAVYSHPDKDPSNIGGHVLWVAIADVAHFVKPGSALDEEARKRGNSTYFADRVVPMLPDRLSGDLCSIHEGIERPCLAYALQLISRARNETNIPPSKYKKCSVFELRRSSKIS